MKKKLRVRGGVVVVLMTALLLAACGDGGNPGNPFVGTWIVTDGWGGSVNNLDIAEFRADGTMQIESKEGRYELEEDGHARVLLPDRTVFASIPAAGEMRFETEYRGSTIAATLQAFNQLPVTTENLVGTWDGPYKPWQFEETMPLTFAPDGTVSGIRPSTQLDGAPACDVEGDTFVCIGGGLPKDNKPPPKNPAYQITRLTKDLFVLRKLQGPANTTYLYHRVQ